MRAGLFGLAHAHAGFHANGSVTDAEDDVGLPGDIGDGDWMSSQCWVEAVFDLQGDRVDEATGP